MGVEGEERVKKKKKIEKQKQTQNHVTSHHTHNTHAPPFPSTFGCVLGSS